MEIEMTALPKTWILDLDGTIVKHNGYKIDGADSLLEGADNLLSQIKENDMVIFVTSRKRDCQEMTERFLDQHGIRYDQIIYEAPYGERILVNDRKPCDQHKTGRGIYRKYKGRSGIINAHGHPRKHVSRR